MTKAILGVLLAIAAPVFAEAQSITVDAKHQIARVPRRLFGTNVRQNMESDGQVRSFLKETGITLFRYPDSVDSGYTWDWDAGGVMARDGKPMTSKLARLDTVIDLVRDVKAEIFFTTKIYGSTPEEAARWVAEAKKRGVGGGILVPGQRALLPRRQAVHPPRSLRRSGEPLRARYEGGRPGNPRRDGDGRDLYRRAGRQGARQLRGPRREAAHRLRRLPLLHGPLGEGQGDRPAGGSWPGRSS